MRLIIINRICRGIICSQIYPENPILGIGISETLSYTIPFLKEDSIIALNNIPLFLIYYILYNESAKQTIQAFYNRDLYLWKLENLLLILFIISTIQF